MLTILPSTPIRAGSDVAFLGGLVNCVINNPRWNNDPFFKTWTVHYTNAATIISDDFKDTEELDLLTFRAQSSS